MMSTRSGRLRQSIVETSPPRIRKGPSPSRSPARKRRSSPNVSTTQKSPSRKSPSRKPSTKYPARKSPSRAVKEITEIKDNKEIRESLAPRSPSRRLAIKKNVEVLSEDASKLESLRNTRSRRLEYSVADLHESIENTDFLKYNLLSSEKLNGADELDNVQSNTDIYSLRNRRGAEEVAPRRSSRLKEIFDLPNERQSMSKSLSKSASKSVSKSIDTYSDEELCDELIFKDKSKSRSISRKLATPLPNSVTSTMSNRMNEFAGRFGVTVLYVLLPLTVFYILISCSKSCSYTYLEKLLSYKTMSLWFSSQPSIIVIVNFLLQAIFLSIPVFGTSEVDDHGRKYYFNAFFSSFLNLNILFVLDYYKVLNVDTLLNSYLQMATVSYLIAFILAFILYLKSLKIEETEINPYGNSGSLIYDFFMGREIQAYIMNINVKLLLARVSNISTLILSILIFRHGFLLQDREINNISMEDIKMIIDKVHFKPTVIVYSMMQLIYALYFIMREKKIVSTFYWHSEGLGYLQIVASALYPYYFTTVSKYVADSELTLTTNVLIATCALFLLGMIIMLMSNNIKYEFRKNPLQASLMHLDSMPTFHGKKLLVSHMWGVLRHPNYTGDILIHIALAIPGFLSKQIVASAPAIITIVMLLHRCWRDHWRCKRRYGAAWQRYCKRVPSVIVPELL